MPKNHELVTYTAPDGTPYEFRVPSEYGRWVLSNNGWGAPPVRHITQTGPQQHGATVRDYRLDPRVILLLIHQRYCARSEYWAGRANLLDVLRPNRQAVAGAIAPGTLTITRPDGVRRAVRVHIAQGPEFTESATEWDRHSFQEVLRFIAYDPIAFDPALKTVTVSPLSAELTFPITFPITFGIDQTETINYLGTWQEYPTLVLTGPMEGFTVTNVTTGEFISVGKTLVAGETVTIALPYGAKTVTSSIDGNVIGTVSADSDLSDFHLAPDPEAPNGANVLRFAANGLNSASAIQVQYYDRYYGI